MSRPSWIIWDWNGTLLDDTEASLRAFNELLVSRRLQPIDLKFYQDHFAFPVRSFYAKCGIDVDREDWDQIGRDYHAAYAHYPKRLNVEALSALETVKRAGVHQAMLSALRQDLLESALREYGVRDYFEFVVGSDNLGGGSKLAQAHRLLEELQPLASVSSLLLIGDSLHDAEVAKALGIRCILCAQGGHSAERLREVGPTANTLMEAIFAILSAS